MNKLVGALAISISSLMSYTSAAEAPIVRLTLRGVEAPSNLAAERGCYATHLAEAQIVNRERAPIYRHLVAQLGGGMAHELLSAFVSEKLITFEKLTEGSFANGFDQIAKKYESRAGFNLTCDAFVSMDKIGSMDFKVVVPTVRAMKRAPLDIFLELKKLALSKRDESFLDAINLDLGQMADSPFDCMLRHVLESTRRLVELRMVRQSELASYPELAAATNKLIDQHLNAVIGSSLLDWQARPLHQLGIPIICNDVPQIPSIRN